MKGGVGLYITYYIRLEYIREGWCGTLHDITIHSWRVGWEFTFHFTSHGCRSPWNGCMIVVTWCCHVRWYMQVCHAMLQNALYGCKNVAWGLCWGGSRSTWSGCRQHWKVPCVCGGCGCNRFIVESVLPWCSAYLVVQCCSCVRSSLRFLNLWLQIAFEWLHDCCHLVLSYA